VELPIFATLISNSRFFGLLSNFIIHKTIKCSCCLLTFMIIMTIYDDIFIINGLMECVFVLQVTINSLYFEVLSVNITTPTGHRM